MTDFDAFWLVFPRRVAKLAAQKAYAKAIKLASAAEILAGAQRYALQVQGKDPQFICHGSTWLAGARWMDEPEALPQPQRRKTAAEITGENLRREIAELQGQSSQEGSDLFGAGRVLAISRQTH